MFSSLTDGWDYNPLALSGQRSNDNEEVLNIFQSSRIVASPQDVFYSQIQDTRCRGDLPTPAACRDAAGRFYRASRLNLGWEGEIIHLYKMQCVLRI